MLVAMVIVPLIAIALVGRRLVEDQEALARHEVERAFGERLKSLDQAVQTIVRGLERELLRAVGEVPRTSDAQVLREALARLPRGPLALVLDKRGKVVFPPLEGPMSERELAFLERTRTAWEGGVLESTALMSALGDEAGPARAAQAKKGDTPRTSGDRGWITFFHGGGQHFLWWFADHQRLIALEVSGVELMTELVSQLPETPVAGTDPDGASEDERTVLADATGRVIYQWGQREPNPRERPKATLGLSEPLASWTLRHFAPESGLPTAITRTLATGFYGGLAGLGLALGAGAWLIWRARTRESRLAAQRVSFVNQVSHELKTPLTSIRMYADLLKEAHDDADIQDGDPAQRHLAVIARESDRLSRLIKNVLTFARGQEHRLGVSPRAVVPDEVVRAAIGAHEPALAQAGITLETELGAGVTQSIDPDALEQILSNLLSNVEKYARAGRWAKVATRVDGDRLIMTVADRGPGVPEAQRELVFEPFWRASDKLSDGVTGTGIGLDIARRLARLHGGDLVCRPANDGGAIFEATLRAGVAFTEV